MSSQQSNYELGKLERKIEKMKQLEEDNIEEMKNFESNFCYESDGKFYDLDGNEIDPNSFIPQVIDKFNVDILTLLYENNITKQQFLKTWYGVFELTFYDNGTITAEIVKDCYSIDIKNCSRIAVFKFRKQIN